eukprot:12931445-Prorocentrum_lima.AAC.1
MQPPIQQWMYMRDPVDKPLWVRADGSTRRTSPYKVETVLGDDDQPDQDYIDMEEEPPLTALKARCQPAGV